MYLLLAYKHMYIECLYMYLSILSFIVGYILV